MRISKNSVAGGVAAAKNCVAKFGSWTWKHRQGIAAGATTVLTVAWVLAPEPSGKIYGSALIGRNLATLGFGSTRIGLAIASGLPTFVGWAAGKMGSGRKTEKLD